MAVLTSTHNLCFWAEIRKIITKTRLLKYTKNIYHQKTENFQIKRLIVFHFSATVIVGTG